MKDIDKELDNLIRSCISDPHDRTIAEAKQAIKQLINKARMDSLDQFTKDFNIYASEHREQFSLESIGMIWGLLAKQQIPLQDRLKELKSDDD